MSASAPVQRAEYVALGRLGRITRSLKTVEARQQDLERRRTQLIAEEIKARRAYEQARDRRKAMPS
jgi:hypothetical protein